MADETHHIRGINWRETFLFTHIFRSFGIAIHPSKMFLAMVAICLLYLGGRTLDAVWPTNSRGVQKEIEIWESMPDFNKIKDEQRKEARNHYSELLQVLEIKNGDKLLTPEERYEAALSGGHMSEIKSKISGEIDRQAKLIEERHKYESAAIESGTLPEVQPPLEGYLAVLNDDAKAKDLKGKLDDLVKKATEAQVKKDGEAKAEARDTEADKRKEANRREMATYKTNLTHLYEVADQKMKAAEAIQGYGLFSLIADYEVDRVNELVNGVTQNNWFGGLTDHGSTEHGNADHSLAGLGFTGRSSSGVFDCLLRMFWIAPRWAISQHFVYFVFFGAFFFIVWAIFGGAIARIAAIHVSRDEKPSIRSALRFSAGKFFSFLCAPVIPLIIIGVVGLIVAIGGLLLYVPFIGEIAVGVFYFLALAGGFVMTLVTVGTIGGINLMFPTIASEGSDSFDAISRSFSYVYNRPWRMFWYTCVSIAYGALTFLFVRIFIFLMLGFTHHFTGLLVVKEGNAGGPAFQGIWPGSKLWNLTYSVNHLSLTSGQRIAAFFVALWVFLAIAALGAYVITYYFSSSAIVYFLMRREVDATEMDDVYLEQLEEEFVEPSPSTTTATSSNTPAQLPAGSTPAAAANPPTVA